MDGTDAPAYRVLEFIMDTPATMDKRRGDALKQQLDANSGYAADIYLRNLIQPDTLKYIKSALPKWTDEIWNRTGLDKEHRFWVRTIASVIAAGAIVKNAGLLDFSIDRISGWAIEQVQDKKQLNGANAGHRNGKRRGSSHALLKNTRVKFQSVGRSFFLRICEKTRKVRNLNPIRALLESRRICAEEECADVLAVRRVF
jgi:hypothetical protein